MTQHAEADTHAARRGVRSFYAALAVLVGLLFAATLAFVIGERARTIESELERISQLLVRDLDETLRRSVENLRAASNFIVFYKDITYSQFLEITQQSFDTDPGLLIIEWQRVVAGEGREAFVQAARQRGLPEFRLWELDDSGAPVDARPRPEHVPVYFMRARERDTQAISTVGLDLAWSPDRMRSKWEARDSARARASGLFDVVTSRSGDFSPRGFAITLPIYERGYAPTQIEARRTELTGYMAGVYALDSVIRSRLASGQFAGVNLDIHDAPHDPGAEGERLLIEAGSPSSFRVEVDYDLYGETLHLGLVATRDFVRQQFQLPWLALPVTVLLLGLTILLFLRHLETGHRRLSAAQVELKALNAQLEDLSRYDPLTNVYNRRAFAEKTAEEIHRVDRQAEPASLLLLDLDHFKDINDRWGHRAGDQVLVEFAAICRSETRSVDTVARLGGEEFAIVLSHADHGEALQLAERLRKRVENAKFVLADHRQEIEITVSIGISTIDRKMAPAKWIDQADKALYVAKRSGRNCVRVFE